jgi:outer membrane protein OmpA-like peptidoglycan-associated protein
MKKLFLILLITNNFCLITLAQQQVAQKAMAAYFKAKDFGSRTQWEEGIVELQKAIKIQPDYTQAKELLGEYFFALKKYDDAIAILESSANDKDFSARSVFLLSEIFLKNNNGEKAKLYAEKYIARKDKVPNAAAKASQTILNANFAIEAKKNPVPFNPKNLGASINTKANEYFPYLTPDGKVFTFTRMDGRQEDLFYANRNDTVFSNAMSYGNNVNTDDNEGASAMDAQGNFLFVTACNRMDGYGSCDIYYSVKQNNTWTAPQGIGKPVNTGAWEAQPSFSSDGSALYFASNRPGGFGGRDIWVSYLDTNMKLSEPKNLGPNINTKYDDQCPFIHADNQTLYFTSNGWPGMGNGDIYISRKTDTGWTKAVNIGYPINTENDDNGMTVSYDGKTAFLSSSRAGGFGGLDLYSFELPENMQPKKTTYIKAVVKDAKSKQLLNASYSIIDLDTKKEVYKGNTSNGKFFVSIELNKNDALQIQKEGYLFYSQNINLKETTTETKPYEIEVLLEPIAANSKITLNNVFFDFDKNELKQESFVELDKLADLLKKNPTVKIEISGHTDNKGDKKYNLTLSQKRAESVVNYLVQKGIVAARLVAKGYGDTMPIAPNDTEENKAKNRRTEVKVL